MHIPTHPTRRSPADRAIDAIRTACGVTFLAASAAAAITVSFTHDDPLQRAAMDSIPAADRRAQLDDRGRFLTPNQQRREAERAAAAADAARAGEDAHGAADRQRLDAAPPCVQAQRRRSDAQAAAALQGGRVMAGPGTGLGGRVTILEGEHAGRQGRVVARTQDLCIAHGGARAMADVQLARTAGHEPQLVRVHADALEPATERSREAA